MNSAVGDISLWLEFYVCKTKVKYISILFYSAAIVGSLPVGVVELSRHDGLCSVCE